MSGQSQDSVLSVKRMRRLCRSGDAHKRCATCVWSFVETFIHVTKNTKPDLSRVLFVTAHLDTLLTWIFVAVEAKARV